MSPSEPKPRSGGRPEPTTAPPAAATTRALVRVERRAAGEAPGSPVMRVLRLPVALYLWLRARNRARIARRRVRQREAAAAAEKARTEAAARKRLEDFAAGVPNLFAHASWAQTPASHTAAWDAYERLAPELKRLAHARLAAYEPRDYPLVQALRDLAAFARGIELPATDAPRVSIVIPAFNHVRETLECIAAVALHTTTWAYEVIVVDDASKDGSEELLPLVRNLRHLRNEENRGFVCSCNRGAGEARGEYLVFLNNDAQPVEGWLEPLVETFTAFERVGAVGPKLVYPNGRLQDAGSMVNPDLSITMVGVGDDPGRARYNYAREVHYCSGACLVVEKKRFDEVGGFAAALQPAYYEDCDLQLELRRRGLRTIYQPASVVVHHLSLTKEGLPDPLAFKKRQIVKNSQKMREKWGETVDAMDAVRLIALYLPQFHRIPENDLWWGKGFTEWTNVAKARPNFAGHEQPHLPTELGFYDLRLPGVMDEQARLARAYGISGFCFYYYWFHGKRLLEMPVERLLEGSSSPIPFCLCWANENWTRAWDGGDGGSEILIGQEHSDADDEAVIRDLGRFLRHPSYIRVNGRPLLLVYRVELFPDIQRTTDLWREVCRREGIGELHLVRVDSFENALRAEPPARQGFDAAMEFPPHHRSAPFEKGLTIDPEFEGSIHDYEAIALESVAFKDASYLHYRCVMPRWDNTARRQHGSAVFARATPGAYQAWLEQALRYTREQNVGDERLVFVNAWNEWAEGAHLEPERRYGRGFLEATRNALEAHLVKAED